MNLPKIDLSLVPDLNELVGMFGSTIDTHAGGLVARDALVVVMVYLYDSGSAVAGL